MRSEGIFISDLVPKVKITGRANVDISEEDDIKLYVSPHREALGDKRGGGIAKSLGSVAIAALLLSLSQILIRFEELLGEVSQ